MLFVKVSKSWHTTVKKKKNYLVAVSLHELCTADSKSVVVGRGGFYGDHTIPRPHNT